DPADRAVVVDNPDCIHHHWTIPLQGGPLARETRIERQEQGEARVSGGALALDRAVVLRDEGLRDREAEPAAACAARDEREEDLLEELRRNAGPIVDDGDREREPEAPARKRHAAGDARLEADIAASRRAVG